jgi:Zn-dependent protease with chaperone function
LTIAIVASLPSTFSAAKTSAHHLLSTHPTTQARLERLTRMSAELSGSMHLPASKND